jgi:hypothetical protein
MDAIKFSQVNSRVNAKLKTQVPKTISLSLSLSLSLHHEPWWWRQSSITLDINLILMQLIAWNDFLDFYIFGIKQSFLFIDLMTLSHIK